MNIFKKLYRKITGNYSGGNIESFLKTCSEKQLSYYINKHVDTTDQKIVDYSKGTGWGHSIQSVTSISDITHRFCGFYSGGQIIGSRGLRVGDILLVNTKEGVVSKYLILDYEGIRDPRDMFYAYVVGIS